MFQRMMLLFFRPASVYTLPGFRWDIFPPCAAPASIIGSDVLFCHHNRLRICSVFYRSWDQGGEESRSGRLYSRESQNLNYLEYSVCDLWPKVYPVQCHDQVSSNGSPGCLWIPSALDIASIDLNRPCRFFVIHVPSEIIVSPDNSVFQLMLFCSSLVCFLNHFERSENLFLCFESLFVPREAPGTRPSQYVWSTLYLHWLQPGLLQLVSSNPVCSYSMMETTWAVHVHQLYFSTISEILFKYTPLNATRCVLLVTVKFTFNTSL